MCKFSKKAAQKHANQGKVFKIERNIQDLHTLAEELKVFVDEDGNIIENDGEAVEKTAAKINKKIKSATREGLSSMPITMKDLCRNIPALHAKLHVRQGF